LTRSDYPQRSNILVANGGIADQSSRRRRPRLQFNTEPTHVAQNYELALEPVDRAEKIPVSDRDAAMTPDVVRRRFKEEEIRQRELLQIVTSYALHKHLAR
jgi:hypothetical protein